VKQFKKNNSEAMRSLIRHECRKRISLWGILALFFLLFCSGALMAQPITVEIRTPGGANEVCQDPTFSFILTAYAEGGNQDFVDFEWTADPGMLNPQGNYAIFNNSFSAIPGLYNISVTVFDSDGNSGTGNITITLKETPTVKHNC
jgi:hypothetical protein